MGFLVQALMYLGVTIRFYLDYVIYVVKPFIAVFDVVKLS